ncbi:MAG: hypothetical protein QMB03_02445, partial [Spirosomataceae bacterium]
LLNCSKLGFKTPQQLYKITNGQTKGLRASLSEKIKKIYPKVNLNWLDAGVGEPSVENEKSTEIEGLKAELELQKVKYENIILKITATKEQKGLLGIS